MACVSLRELDNSALLRVRMRGSFGSIELARPAIGRPNPLRACADCGGTSDLMMGSSNRDR